MRGLLGAIGSLALVGSSVGCVDVVPLGEGGRCTRNLECAPGLVCNAGTCTSDLTGYGEGVTPTRGMDAGEALDAPVIEEVDAFGPPGVDAAMPDAAMPDAATLDAFTPTPDAFVPSPDAFTPPPDAFTPTPDAFTPAPDAFVEAPDAFVEEPDAGG